MFYVLSLFVMNMLMHKHIPCSIIYLLIILCAFLPPSNNKVEYGILAQNLTRKYKQP
jgi:hypothetical protein